MAQEAGAADDASRLIPRHIFKILVVGPCGVGKSSKKIDYKN